jgi:methyltransferase (TIGR00027 family)
MQQANWRESGAPSRTSIMVAAGRAFGALEPDPAVRNPDYLAARFLSDAELDLIREHPIVAALRGGADAYETNRHITDVGIIATLMHMRTRYIDDELARAVGEGATQIVILGAGLDTRAYRLRDILDAGGVRPQQSPTVFEVDFPATQANKRARVAEVIGQEPGYVRYVPVDLSQADPGAALEAAGFERSRKSFFVLEGVSMYLTPDRMASTLAFVRSAAAPGSRLVLDFITESIMRSQQKHDDMPASKYTSNWGEPWFFGVPDGKERQYFEAQGFRVDEIIGFMSPSTAHRFLKRADGTIVRPDRRRTREVEAAVGKDGNPGLVKFLWRMLPAIGQAVFHGSKLQGIALLSVP